MSAVYDSITNRGEYFAAHYFAEELNGSLRKDILDSWTTREGDKHDPRRTPRQQIRSLRARYLGDNGRSYFAAGSDAFVIGADDEWRKKLAEWHQEILSALGYPAGECEIVVHRAGRDHRLTVACHTDNIIAIDCGWATETDNALDPAGAARLLHPLRVSASEEYTSGPALATWLFQTELGQSGGPRPRFVLLLVGAVIILADRQSWTEGRYLAVNLDAALERYDRAQAGELATIAALFSYEMLRPGDNDPAPAMDKLLKASSTNAVGVSTDLRHGLQRSVEIIANEVLHRMAESGNDVSPADIESPDAPFARELTRESLRYLYRILFLLYAEARPELGILPADDDNYETGYSMARLRELVSRDEQLADEDARNSLHLFLSLDVLFDKINRGHRPYGTEDNDDKPDDDEWTRREKAARRSEDLGLRFEALRSKLFEPTAIRLIGNKLVDPRSDDDQARRLDLRLRNEALHQVLRLLTLKKGVRGQRGGFISYRNLGINQLGAVYEGLMSYTGIIADEELCEVAKNGKPDDGSWLIPAHKQGQYPDTVLVQYDEDDARRGLRGVKRYPKGSFVYRLAGRDRETSASYYTPESLTKVTVELALKEVLDQGTDETGKVIKTRASRLLSFKICEPALGSGAFLNEAINQVAEEYLRRRQDELGTSIPTADLLTEKQRVKAYIALHNAYGVDLNDTGVELAEISLWLNTTHPGMQAPWFGLHLRRGNSLIGARRAYFNGADISSSAKEWLKARGAALPPTPLPFVEDSKTTELPQDAIHQFLLPAPGWAAVSGSTEAKRLAAEQVSRLSAWRRGILQRPSRSTTHLNKDGSPKRDPRTGVPKVESKSQFTRLRDAARRVEFLWSLVIKRMELSERDIARRIPIWGADPNDTEFSFIQRPQKSEPKEKILRELFEDVDTPYWRLKTVMDAWCALWFWPAEQVGLLDGTDSEYTFDPSAIDTNALATMLGTTQPFPDSSTSEPDLIDSNQAPSPLASAPRPLFSAAPLFHLDGEQAVLDEIDWRPDSPEELPAPKPPQEPKQGKKKKKTSPRRSVVPLRDLNDWLDFLEAMLGTTDIVGGTVIDGIERLEDLGDLEKWVSLEMDMDLANPEDRFPWIRTVRAIAERESFLHWELEFALVFASNGGFDLQVGNPPWVRPRWDEAAVLAEYEPWFKLEKKPPASEVADRRNRLLARSEVRLPVLRENTQISAYVSFLGSPQVYPLIAGTQPDFYRGFMCQVWNHAAVGGAIGIIHPDTHFSGVKEARLRAEAYRRLRLHGDFVNAGNRFFPPPVGRSSHFGVHIYGDPRRVQFKHLSWLFSVDSLRLSQADNGVAEPPGVRYRGKWDERPHLLRVVTVDEQRLSTWRTLLNEDHLPVEQAGLLSPVSTAEAAAIDALAAYPLRLAELDPQISRGFDEAGAKEDNLIEYNDPNSSTGERLRPVSWNQVILKGAQLGVANPMFRSDGSEEGDTPSGTDLRMLSPNAVPDTPYRAVDGRDAEFQRAHSRWIDYTELARLSSDPQVLARLRNSIAAARGVPEEHVETSDLQGPLRVLASRPYVDFFRVAWRRQIADDTERALYAALLPPGPSHVHAVQSLALGDWRMTALLAGFWASLPLDYLLRATGKKDLGATGARSMPAPDADHPLASALLLRTLRLNCLTSAYGEIWEHLYESKWLAEETWACDWPGLRSLHGLSREWTPQTPLRTERARRAALVEIDALVAVWLGISADALCAIYKARFPVLQDFESVTWFDAQERKIAGNRYTYGYGQTKESWESLMAHLRDRENVDVPEGYAAPFYQAAREDEMRKAHAVFQARMDAAVALGQWDPMTRKAAMA
jgi:hypothetical protein